MTAVRLAKLIVCLILGMLLPVTASLAEGDLSLSVGIEYTTGDYGQSPDTEMIYVPVTLRYETYDYTTWLTVPYLLIDGPGNVIPDLGPIHGGGSGGMSFTSNTTTTESGLGDVIAGLSINVYADNQRGELVDLTGKIKFGTADADKSLGTGENDYSLQVDLYKRIRDYTLFGSLGYTMVGDPPGVNLDDRTYYSLGLAHKFSDQTEGGVILDARSSAFDVNDYDQQELTGYIIRRISSERKIQYYVIYGLEQGSPDAGFGVVLTQYL